MLAGGPAVALVVGIKANILSSAQHVGRASLQHQVSALHIGHLNVIGLVEAALFNLRNRQDTLADRISYRGSAVGGSLINKHQEVAVMLREGIFLRYTDIHVHSIYGNIAVDAGFYIDCRAAVGFLFRGVVVAVNSLEAVKG